jgi:hypothetical protein
MALKFRRGTTAQQSGSLAFGEPYVNTTLGTLVIGGQTGDIVLSTSGTGSAGNFGAISGSGLDIIGNANIGGNLTLGGQLTIGDNTSDTVNVVASLSSSLIPQTDNIFDLGSETKSWRDLYISTGSIKIVSNGTVVSTLSTNADGSQNFPNGLSVTGSLKTSGSIVLGNQLTTTTIKNLNGGGFTIFATGSNASRGAVYIGYLDGGIESNSPVAINGPAVNVGGYSSALTINGPSSGVVGGGIWLSRTGNGNIPWGILSDGTDNLYFGRGDAFTDNQIQFNYKGISPNILFSGSGIVPATANTYDLGTLEKPWREIYVSTGSINFVNNGNVVGTLSTTANSLNFGSNITIGSGSFEIGRRGTTHKNTNLVMGLDVMSTDIVTGQHNIGMGSEAGASLNSGNYNIMLGYQAGRQISNAVSNVLIGQGAGNTLLTYNSIVPSFNTFVGGNAGQFMWTGQRNVALGNVALYGQAGGTNTFQNNTAIGYGTATTITGVSTNNIYIGAYAGPASSFTTETYKFYVSNGDQNQQPYMFGNMANDSRSLNLNSSVNISGSLNMSGSIIPAINNTYDLGSATKSWRDLYISTGSIKIVSGNTVVSTISTNADGSQNFEKGLNVSGSLIVTGSITATGDVVAFSTSDRRHKNNIVLISDALSKVTKLNGVTWEWNEDVDSATKETPKTGLIAQEVQEVLPEVVKERVDGFLALDYSKMMGLMVEAIKEQQEQINSLLIKINELENK